jgi:guanylate kinase
MSKIYPSLREPLCFCFCGPSGSGQDSISAEVIKRTSAVVSAIRTTSRPTRGFEKNGHDYVFVSREEFLEKLKNNEMIEYTEYAGNFYGVGKENLERARSLDSDLIVGVDIPGTKSFRKLYGEHVIVIALVVPKIEDLRNRLRRRGVNSEEEIETRMNISRIITNQILDEKIGDYIVVNNDFEKAVADVCSIINACRLNFGRIQKDFHDLLRNEYKI